MTNPETGKILKSDLKTQLPDVDGFGMDKIFFSGRALSGNPDK